MFKISWESKIALTDDLAAYYKFEEISGDLLDAHGTNDAIVLGATRGETGKIDNCYYFNGTTNNCIESPYSVGSSFSVSIWMKHTRDNGFLYAKDDMADWDDVEYRFRFNAIDNKVYFELGNTDNIGFQTISAALNEDTWYHIVGTFDGTNMILYIDGSPVDTETFSGTRVSAYNNSYFASRSPNNGLFRGYLDEIALWNRALSSTEVSKLYNSGDGLSYNHFFQPQTAGVLDLAKIKGVPKFLQVRRKEREGELKLKGGEIRPLNTNSTFEYSIEEKIKTTKTYTTLISASHKSNTGKVVITAVAPWLATGTYADASFRLTQGGHQINGTESLNNWATGDGQVSYTTQGYYEPEKEKSITYALQWKQGEAEANIVTGGTFGAYNIFVQDII